MSKILLALRKAQDEKNWNSPFNGQMAELLTGEQVSTNHSRRTRRRSRRARAEAANGHQTRREQTGSDEPLAELPKRHHVHAIFSFHAFACRRQFPPLDGRACSSLYLS